MVRCYKRKSEDPKYSEVEVQIAVQECRVKKKNKRRLTALGKEKEEDLTRCLATLEKRVLDYLKEVLKMVSRFVNENQIETPLKYGIPGTDWFMGFKKRHKLTGVPKVLGKSLSVLCGVLNQIYLVRNGNKRCPGFCLLG
ncbi:unnamed protein product [Psylliodes chrysocephalus]|uniref:Uncharacterized protein n=1 Tax=Psylliodes chrysocephalus TaxID=3402493 RepID=A0A9P0D076_9CUCU|nr:unnamed protein product [Psylliodes chrysocephala]